MQDVMMMMMMTTTVMLSEQLTAIVRLKNDLLICFFSFSPDPIPDELV